MIAMHIRKGDMVEVTVGDDAGNTQAPKVGKILLKTLAAQGQTPGQAANIMDEASKRGVRAHPFTAREQRGPDIFAAQVINDVAVVAGDFAALFAKIECQRDEFFILRKIDTADSAAQVRRNGRCRRQRL